MKSNQNSKTLYLELIKKSLLNLIYSNPNSLVKSNKTKQMVPVKEARQNGADWPQTAFTMIGMERLNNIQFCCEDALLNNVPGDFIETGVWRGGSVILMKAILEAYEIKNRKVWAADSFRGLPPPNLEKYPKDAGLDLSDIEELSVSQEEVAENFSRYNLLDDQVFFLEGWFKDTLPAAPIEEIAVLRLDGDLYESTMDSLTALYPKLSPGGYIIIDDFGGIRPCREAVLDYRKEHGITEEIHPVDFTAVYWQKEKQTQDNQIAQKIQHDQETYKQNYQQSLKSWAFGHQEKIVMRQSHWMGIKCWKSPLDIWVYQELIVEQKPDFIIEIGSKFGGSTLYFAQLLDALGKGNVISIDIDRDIFEVDHDRIISLTGDSGSEEIVEQVYQLCRGKSVFIIHDGDHHYQAVLRDLKLYSDLVPIGGYFVVEDGIVDLFEGFEPRFKGPGPLWAIEEFLIKNNNFIADPDPERYILTQSPRGFLRRIE